MVYRTPQYRKIEEEVDREYKVDRSTAWGRKFAPKWRNRVGFPRLVAEAALFDSIGLLRSISRSLFRNDPEGREKYDRALEALDDLTSSFSRENWRRFNGEKGN